MAGHFFAVLSRMKYINRWALMYNTRGETLSEHSLETAFIAHALAVISNKRCGGSINAERCALVAMYHDATEILTGDMPTPIKYYNPEIKDAYKKIEAAAGEEMLEMLPEDLKSEYKSIYFEADEDIKRLIKAADKISALIKCTEEIKRGNDEFRVAAKETKKAIKKLGVREAEIFLDEFFESYSLSLDEQKKN